MLSIGLSDIGSYLTLHKLLAIHWYDCCGSIGKYFSVISESKQDLLQLTEKLNSNLFLDLSNNENLLKEVLKPFLDILENGEYHISFTSQIINDWTFEICDRTNVEKEEQIQSKYKSKDSNGICRIEKTTYNFYPGNKTILLSTIPSDQINQEKVKEYELQIKNGKRPFAIGISAYYQNDADEVYKAEYDDFDADWYSETYILDGHHKLLAYKNLELNPPFATIHRNYKSMLETKFDFDIIKGNLYSWQTEHILKNWEGKDKYENGKRINY